MKLLSAVFAMATLLSASDPKVAPRPAAAQRLTVPKGAVESEPGTFHYTDAQGKKWIYRQTPFGVARLRDVPDGSAPGSSAPGSKDAAHMGFGSGPAPAPDLSAGTKASADGDTIHFERPGPFGIYKWDRNKSDLTEMEQAAWNRQLAKTPAR